MGKLGFDNDKYLSMQSEHIRERISLFGGKLYLEFGGKLFDDYHASRVLPGFQPDSKIRMLQQLRDDVEIVIAVCANDIEKNKLRGDLGISYDDDCLRLMDAFRALGLYVGSIVVTQYAGQSAADAFLKRLDTLGVKHYCHYPIAGYPSDVAHIVSDEGFGKNDYIETTHSLVVVTAPGPGSGKMATCLSQLYHEHKHGVAAGYAKFETFPIWNLPLKHPVNLAYEAATADLNDVNMIDPVHLEAYGKTTVNYNRDVEIFPVLRAMFEKIQGKCPYQSPTDMGVNMAGNCIIDDEVCREASRLEILRRYYTAQVSFVRGEADECQLRKLELVMQQAGVTPDICPAVAASLQKAEETGKPAGAMVLPDGRVVTGKTSSLLGASASLLLNALKAQGGVSDKLDLISAQVIEPISKLKIESLGHHNPRLHSDEVLIALCISALTKEPISMTIIEQLARELDRPVEHIENVVRLLDEGNTIPFIARYRKELHGSMDDTALRTLEERLAYLRNLTERKESVKASIAEQEKLTDELAAAIDAAQTLAEVEDLYRPYKPKRRTRATVAKEKGLEPLAALLFAQERDCPRPEEAAADYLSAEKGVETVADALQGANDIVAEWISDDAAIRRSLRELLEKRGTLRSLAATEEDSVYRLYYDFEQPLSRLQGHQILAINRGEKEKMLSATVLLDRELALPLLRRAVVKPGSAAMEFVKAAAEDAYDRLIYPSLEREMRAALTDKASEGAIKMFALNLKPLLMQPPVKGHVTMGLDPGYAHGCKVAVIDATGKVLDTTVVYPTYGERQKNEAVTKLAQLVKKHGVEHIAIGNGTASRETEQMTVELIHKVGGGLSYMIVSEAGASVYSASKLAAEEFPQFDVNLRSAVSIARRLQDPLAELVKIDPKAIGVGQYQHDMPQKELDASLNAVVEDCVNAVGVDLNTASPSLLTRVAGLNGTIAKNIVAFREENGVFTTRRQLLKVAKLGPKAFEQCAGFLRVPESKNVLDNTGVHPESYDATRATSCPRPSCARMCWTSRT